MQYICYKQRQGYTITNAKKVKCWTIRADFIHWSTHVKTKVSKYRKRRKHSCSRFVYMKMINQSLIMDDNPKSVMDTVNMCAKLDKVATNKK